MERRQKNEAKLVELTSKPLKLQSAISSLMLIAGVIMLVFNRESPEILIGALLAGIGFFWYIVTRVRIWWNHRWRRM